MNPGYSSWPSSACTSLVENPLLKGYLPTCWSQGGCSQWERRARVVPCALCKAAVAHCLESGVTEPHFRQLFIFPLFCVISANNTCCVLPAFCCHSNGFHRWMSVHCPTLQTGSLKHKEDKGHFQWSSLGTDGLNWVIQYPWNQWLNWAVDFQTSRFAFRLLDNSSPLRETTFINKFLTGLFYHWWFCADRFEGHDFTRLHKMKD